MHHLFAEDNFVFTDKFDTRKRDLEELPSQWCFSRFVSGFHGLSFRVQALLVAECQTRWPRQQQLSFL